MFYGVILVVNCFLGSLTAIGLVRKMSELCVVFSSQKKIYLAITSIASKRMFYLVCKYIDKWLHAKSVKVLRAFLPNGGF